MQYDLEPGNFVVNPTKKEWGIGQVQSIIKNKATVNFQNVGKQVINLDNINLEKTKNEINPKLKKDKFGLQRVNWVVGCTMLFDLNRFKNNKIFDENYFMFYEETDLCKRVISKKGIIYSGSELIINHLGEKSSFAVIPKHKIDYIKLRNWHLMWSSFYFSKKHFGFFHSFAIHFYPLIKNFIKYFIFLVFFQKEKSTKHFYRYLGLINSMLGKKSLFRVQIK